jgi:hypothetical protein
MNPSPRAHIYRMLIALAILGVVFLGIRALAIPESWDEQRWFRRDSLDDIAQLPLHYGGNEACQTSGCHDLEQPMRHAEKLATLASGMHQGLACEVCHGPASEHVKDGQKINDAQVKVATEICMSCHQTLTGRPAQFAQFSESEIHHKLLDVKARSICRTCHDPHDPN